MMANRQPLAQGIDGYAENVPQDAIGKFFANMMKATQSGMNNVQISGEVPYTDIKGQTGLGDLLMGESSALVEDMSWGKPIIEPTGHGGKLDSRVGDLMDVAVPAGYAAKAIGKQGIKEFLTPKMPSYDQKGYIGGVKSKKADFNKLYIAQVLKDRGRPEDEIFNQTGWWLGHPDKKPRFEFAHGDERYVSSNKYRDARHSINRQAEKEDRVTTMAEDKEKSALHRLMLGTSDLPFEKRMLDSPMPEHYPDLAANTDIESNFKMKSYGSWDERGKRMKIRNKSDEAEHEMLSTAQHETQHAISGQEGFAPGGSAKSNQMYLMDRVDEEIDNLVHIPYELTTAQQDKMFELQDFRRMVNNADKFKIHNLYKQLADESQARMVQSRAHMTQPQMDASPFYKDYDVPFRKMIVKERGPGLQGSTYDPNSKGVLNNRAKAKALVDKNRRNEFSPRVKLTEQKFTEISKFLAASPDDNFGAIARKAGVARDTVEKIYKGTHPLQTKKGMPTPTQNRKILPKEAKEPVSTTSDRRHRPKNRDQSAIDTFLKRPK